MFRTLRHLTVFVVAILICRCFVAVRDESSTSSRAVVNNKDNSDESSGTSSNATNLMLNTDILQFSDDDEIAAETGQSYVQSVYLSQYFCHLKS